MVHSLKNKIQQAVLQSWSEHCSDHFHLTIGFSGGVDSMVLLHALSEVRNQLGIKIKAIHVHHGLQSIADDWVTFCQQYCTLLDIPLKVVYVNVNTLKIGLEAGAREARYHAYEQHGSDIIALAHHSDDQNETLLLALLRGGSISSLSAMPVIRRLNSTQHVWRPLLSFSKDDLFKYAKEANLDFVEDPSNHSNEYLRNWLRNEWLPSLSTKLPHYSRHFQSTIAHCQDALVLQEEIAEEDLSKIMSDTGFDIMQWAKLSETRRRLSLYSWIKSINIGLPRQANLLNFSQELFKNPLNYLKLSLSNGIVYSYQGLLFFNNNELLNKLKNLNQLLCPKDSLFIDSNQMLDFYLKSNAIGIKIDGIERGQYSIRCATSHDKIRLSFGHKTVFKFLQEQKVPPHLRNIWPIIVDEQQCCVAICNGPVSLDLQNNDGLCLKSTILKSFMVIK